MNEPPVATGEMSEYLSEAAARVEDRLRDLARHESHEAIQSVMRRVLPGGKHLRPVLCLLVAEALDGDADLAMDSALALELIHCGALLHDDVYDRDELRRGAPTLWKQMGDRAAMLLGDLMLGTAFQLVHEAGVATLGRCIAELSRASFREMFRTRTNTAQGCMETIVGKTASLFRTACHLGALTGAVPAAGVKALAGYGEAVGVAFQIADDLCDIRKSLACERFLGDLEARAPSYSLLRAMPSGPSVERYLACEPMDEAAFLRQLQETGCQETAHADIARHQAQALACIQDVAFVRHRPLLEEFPYYAARALLAEK